MRNVQVLIASLFTGAALEIGVSAAGGRGEAWDSPVFWTVGLPLALGAAFALGFLSRGRAWRWAWLIVPSQMATMIVRSDAPGSLWPLTVVLSAILSAPFVVAAFFGSKLRPSRWRV